MSDDRDAQIRQRAYEIWQDEGEPHGREHEHWERAAREIGADVRVMGEPDDAGPEGEPAAGDASSDGDAVSATPLPGYVGAVVKTPGTSA